MQQKKKETPLYIYDIDHSGPLETTHKSYKHIFEVINTFTKSTEGISKLEIQKIVFGSQSCIISDKGITSFRITEPKKIINKFKSPRFCQVLATRSRAQILLLSMSLDCLQTTQRSDIHKCAAGNSTFQRSRSTTSFEFFFGTKKKLKNNVKINGFLNAETQSDFISYSNDLRNEAQKQILMVQNQNCKTYNLRRKSLTSLNLFIQLPSSAHRSRFGAKTKIFRP